MFQKPAVLAIAAITVVGAIAGRCLSSEPTKPAPAPAAIAHISTHGIVVDPQGRPRPNASVVLRMAGRENQFRGFGLLGTSDVLAEVRTDEAGRFAFDNLPLGALMRKTVETLADGYFGADLIALADGFGLGWTPLYGFPGIEEVKIALRTEAAVEGSVEDEQGLPLAGAIVEVIGISRLDHSHDPLPKRDDNVGLTFSAITPRAVTDGEGRFRIAGLPADHFVSLWARHADHPRKYFLAAIGPRASTRPVVYKFRDQVTEWPVQVNPVKLTLAQGRHFVVRVVDENGNPPRGGRITLFSRNSGGKWQDDPLPVDGTLGVSVDFDDYYRAIYVPPEGQAGVCLDRGLRNAVADEIRMVLPASREIEGRVVGDGTDQGLAGVTVVWSSAKSDSAEDSASSKTVTDEEGCFRLLAVPGKGRIKLLAEVAGFFIDNRRHERGDEPGQYIRALDLPDTGPVEPLVIEVSRGLVIRGAVTDSLGAAASGVVVGASKDVGTGLHPLSTRTDAEGRFELAGLDPHDPYVLAAIRDGFAAFVTVAGNADQPLDQTRVVETRLVLQPAVVFTGRVLLNERPLAGVKLMLNRHERVRTRELQTTATDADGRYRLSGLEAGDQYSIEVRPPFAAADAAWKHQSPYIQKLPDNAQGEVTLPDINLRRLNQSLAGVVVDPDGKPIAWARVDAMLRKGHVFVYRGLHSGPLPWTETDLEGRFRLEQLPDEPLSLMAHVKTEAGKGIRFPARVKAEMNQQDVRIVLDPSLQEEP